MVPIVLDDALNTDEMFTTSTGAEKPTIEATFSCGVALWGSTPVNVWYDELVGTKVKVNTTVLEEEATYSHVALVAGPTAMLEQSAMGEPFAKNVMVPALLVVAVSVPGEPTPSAGTTKLVIAEAASCGVTEVDETLVNVE
jgi:hypothetical protein